MIEDDLFAPATFPNVAWWCNTCGERVDGTVVLACKCGKRWPSDKPEKVENFVPKAKNPRKVRERDVEQDHRLETKAAGGIEYKFTSPGRRAVPDRLKLMPIPREHRELVARYVSFREYKRPGEKPTPAQQREHEFLRALGFQVDVISERTK